MTLNQIDPNFPQPARIVPAPIALRVAQYVRMSTELQCYSTQNQMDAIANYAKVHRMVIVHTFADEGKSGLSLSRRKGLLSLLSVVQSGLADFRAILVYDVSRWGRFQDADESGYWEYICKRAGVEIHYCAELFKNDGSLPSVLLKTIKRTMAAEYSRELSVKVFAGQSRLIELGFRQGGPSGFGLRRLLIDQDRHPKGILAKGTRKSLQTDRVVLVPGPEQEQKIVQEIYRAFVDEGKTQIEIANDLNARGIESGSNRLWSYHLVHEILVNPKYIGANVYNRTSVKLHQRVVTNPEPLWIRRDGAFAPLISADLFNKARSILDSRNYVQTDEEMLDQLRSLLLRKGRLSGQIIDQEPGLVKRGAFSHRFGGLKGAYEKLGYIPRRSLWYVTIRRKVEVALARCLNEFTSKLRAVGANVVIDSKRGTICINEYFTVRLVVSQCCPGRYRRWWIPRNLSKCDLTIVARMNAANDNILDYYIFPKSEQRPKPSSLKAQNSLLLDARRFDNLDQICRTFVVQVVGGSL